MTSEPRCHAQGISAADDTVTSSAIGCMLSVMTRQKGLREWCKCHDVNASDTAIMRAGQPGCRL